MSEFSHQCSLFEWAGYAKATHPELRLLTASLNGVRLTKAQAGKAKAAGMRKGEHDVRLPVARGGYIGLSIEMKFGKNKPTPEQIEFGELLEAEGWCVRYCWSWDEARDAILSYLKAGKTFFTKSG